MSQAIPTEPSTEPSSAQPSLNQEKSMQQSAQTKVSNMFNRVKKGIQDGAAEIQKVGTEVTRDIHRAAQNNNMNNPIPSDVANEIQKATNILTSFTDPNKAEGGLDNVIPKEVILNSKGLAIFTVVKAGFVWSARVGSGLVIARLDDGAWSPPSCINIGGVGFGAQLGADVTDFVIILNTADAVKAFSHGENLTLGGNLSVSAGPVGLGAEVSGSFYEGAALFSYSKSKGVFAGVSVEGTAIVERKDANKQFYGREVTVEQVLSGQVELPPNSTDALYDVIRQAEQRQ